MVGLALGQQGFKISQYPQISVVPANYLFIVANPGISNYSVAYSTLAAQMTADISLANATNNDVLTSNQLYSVLYSAMVTYVNTATNPFTGGSFVLTLNGFGTNVSFFGTNLFEVGDFQALNVTNFFTELTNAPFLKTDGDGEVVAGIELPGTNVLLSAGANISFTTNGSGGIEIASSGTNVVDTSTNNLIVVTNIIVYSNVTVLGNTYISTNFSTNFYSSISYITNLYSVTSIITNLYVSQGFITNLYATTNFSTNLFFVSGKGNTLIITNLYVSEQGVLVNSNTAINSAVITDDKHAYTNASNAHGVFTNSATGPPSFGLLQNTEMQNSSITVQGSAVPLGGSTLAAGATPAFGAINITNYNYTIATNNGGGNALVGGANGTAATLYITNITAATTLASFTWPTTVGSGIKMYVSCSGGTDRVLTFPNGCTGAGLGTPPAVTITNSKAAYFDVLCIPGVSTNVFWSPVF